MENKNQQCLVCGKITSTVISVDLDLPTFPICKDKYCICMMVGFLHDEGFDQDLEKRWFPWSYKQRKKTNRTWNHCLFNKEK